MTRASKIAGQTVGKMTNHGNGVPYIQTSLTLSSIDVRTAGCQGSNSLHVYGASQSMNFTRNMEASGRIKRMHGQ